MGSDSLWPFISPVVGGHPLAFDGGSLKECQKCWQRITLWMMMKILTKIMVLRKPTYKKCWQRRLFFSLIVFQIPELQCFGMFWGSSHTEPHQVFGSLEFLERGKTFAENDRFHHQPSMYLLPSNLWDLQEELHPKKSQGFLNAFKGYNLPIYL